MTKELIFLALEIKNQQPEYSPGVRRLIKTIQDMRMRKELPETIWTDPYVHPKFTYYSDDNCVQFPDGQTVNIYPGEKEALDVLIAYGGRTVSYTQINHDPLNAQLTIKRLSRKLEGGRTRRSRKAEGLIIETVQGIGVRLLNPLISRQNPRNLR